MGKILLEDCVYTRLGQATKTSAAIKPGMLLDDDSGEWVAHPTAGGNVSAVLVAEEHPAKDFGSTPALTTAYADGERCIALLNPPAFRGILASGNNVAKWAALESNGDGKLRAAVVGAGLKTALVDGSTAGDFTVTGVGATDRLVAVIHLSTKAAIATAADITAEFSISAADTINNDGGTDTSSDQLLVMYEDANFGGSRLVGVALEAVNATSADQFIKVWRR